MVSSNRRVGLSTEFAALVACLSLVIVGIAVLDRRIATWVHEALAGQRAGFDALTHLVDPLLPLSALGLVAAAVAAAAGWRPGAKARVAIACAVAVVITVTLKDQAKYAFGRLWPETWVDNNPSWIGGGRYGFYPFHGGRGWSSFPSGHMSIVTAPATVLWFSKKLGWFAVLVTSLVAIGLLGADYHFFSDIVAGTLTGWACGKGTLALLSLRWQLGGEFEDVPASHLPR